MSNNPTELITPAPIQLERRFMGSSRKSSRSKLKPRKVKGYSLSARQTTENRFCHQKNAWKGSIVEELSHKVKSLRALGYGKKSVLGITSKREHISKQKLKALRANPYELPPEVRTSKHKKQKSELFIRRNLKSIHQWISPLKAVRVVSPKFQ